MSTTLTIRNLDREVKNRLRVRAATHGRAMEAEARDILTQAVMAPPDAHPPASACKEVRGIWKGRVTTRDVMDLTRKE